jgi:hypothetical protein
MSQTSILSVKNIREENAPQPLPQGDNENGKIVSTGSQIVDALPIRQLSPDSGQENPETTQGGLKIGRKLLAFFNRGKQNPTASTSSSASNVVGVHFRVGRKIGERSTFVVFEGIDLLNGQPIAIMFVWCYLSTLYPPSLLTFHNRNLANAMHICGINIERIKYLPDYVSLVLDHCIFSSSLLKQNRIPVPYYWEPFGVLIAAASIMRSPR